jgi:hypothetical protein
VHGCRPSWYEPTMSAAINAGMLVEKACAMAAEMLKQVGFVHLYSSRVSIASYYAWPGWEKRAGLRIADHKYGGPRRENCFVPMLATITFREQNYRADAAGIRQVPREHITRDVARGIGMYFLRAHGVLMAPAAYHGKLPPALQTEINDLDDVEARDRCTTYDLRSA